ncbi:MAG: TIGR04255 family protein [Microbacteriaceae bacterium]
MALDFGAHQDVVFENAPLTSVLCQVRFSPILSLGARAGLAGFQTALRDLYPILLDPQQTTSIQVSPEPSINVSAPVWRLLDEARVWTVGIAVDFVSLETSRYTSIVEFLGRFDHILSMLHRTLRPADSLRVGLRKVNLIEAPTSEPASLTGIIRQELMGPLRLTDFPAQIVSGNSILHFVESEDASSLVVRYGLGKSDQEKLGFFIDMDYFTERPFGVDGDGALTNCLRHFSEGMTSFFHWAIEDKYKENFGPRPRTSRQD